jgi:hypothetical protein
VVRDRRKVAVQAEKDQMVLHSQLGDEKVDDADAETLPRQPMPEFARAPISGWAWMDHFDTIPKISDDPHFLLRFGPSQQFQGDDTRPHNAAFPEQSRDLPVSSGIMPAEKIDPD